MSSERQTNMLQSVSVLKSMSYLVRCDEASVRLQGQLRDWIEETNRVFLGIANGLPHLHREIEEGKWALGEMHGKISDDEVYCGEDSPRTNLIRTFSDLIDTHRQDQSNLAEFIALFDVVHTVRTALGSVADLMEDVECFSVNAIVQAHNAGDRGRGFSQVSREVVNLTKRASMEFERVRGQAQQIDKKLEELKASIERSHKNFEEAPIHSAEEIEALFARLDDARATVVGRIENLIVRVGESSSRVSRVLVGLQFDDRCSQISHHLAQILGQLHREISELMVRDSQVLLEGEGVEELLDAVCFSLAVFDVVEKLIASLENDLAGARSDMSEFLDGLAFDMQQNSEDTIDVQELMDVIGDTRRNLEEFSRYMHELVSHKAAVISQAEELAGQIGDLRDDLEGVRRTAKRFGVMASIIKVELASAGLSEEFGDALSAERVENLYRDMASAVGSVLIALETTVKQVQRRCAKFRNGLVQEEGTLRQAAGFTNRLVKDLDGTLVRYLNRGGSSFKNTLTKLHRGAATLRGEVNNIINLGRQSGRVKSESRERASHLTDIRMRLLNALEINDWEIQKTSVKDVLTGCTVQLEREVMASAMGGEAVEEGDDGNDLTLF
ncbi:MAG: methyl-accepting chemotaxis protein [Leptospirillia bacterium]